jgi:PleD family two-component response regulator
MILAGRTVMNKKKKSRILIVDDEAVNIQMVEKALQNEYDICSAHNGYDAIRQLKEKQPDLILLDIMMPDLSGFDVCKIIKADEMFADIPILFLTAMDTMTGETMGLESGGIDYLTKPVNLDLLKLRVHNHIDLKERNDLIREQRDLLARQKEELEAALARVKQLEGIIPICMYCKKIRDDQKSWHQLERYISEHSEAVFSHGVCPDCLAEQMNVIRNLKL